MVYPIALYSMYLVQGLSVTVDACKPFFSTIPSVLEYSQHTVGSHKEIRPVKCSTKFQLRDSSDLLFQNDCMGCLDRDLPADRKSTVEYGYFSEKNFLHSMSNVL